jgi:hypothetical protein
MTTTVLRFRDVIDSLLSASGKSRINLEKISVHKNAVVLSRTLRTS